MEGGDVQADPSLDVWRETYWFWRPKYIPEDFLRAEPLEVNVLLPREAQSIVAFFAGDGHDAEVALLSVLCRCLCILPAFDLQISPEYNTAKFVLAFPREETSSMRELTESDARSFSRRMFSEDMDGIAGTGFYDFFPRGAFGFMPKHIPSADCYMYLLNGALIGSQVALVQSLFQQEAGKPEFNKFLDELSGESTGFSEFLNGLQFDGECGRRSRRRVALPRLLCQLDGQDIPGYGKFRYDRYALATLCTFLARSIGNHAEVRIYDATCGARHLFHYAVELDDRQAAIWADLAYLTTVGEEVDVNGTTYDKLSLAAKAVDISPSSSLLCILGRFAFLMGQESVFVKGQRSKPGETLTPAECVVRSIPGIFAWESLGMILQRDGSTRVVPPHVQPMTHLDCYEQAIIYAQFPTSTVLFHLGTAMKTPDARCELFAKPELAKARIELERRIRTQTLIPQEPLLANLGCLSGKELYLCALVVNEPDLLLMLIDEEPDETESFLAEVGAWLTPKGKRLLIKHGFMS